MKTENANSNRTLTPSSVNSKITTIVRREISTSNCYPIALCKKAITTSQKLTELDIQEGYLPKMRHNQKKDYRCVPMKPIVRKE